MPEDESEMALYQSDPTEEDLRITCSETEQGGLLLQQACDGELCAWCFGESPHGELILIGNAGVRRLCAYFEVATIFQVILVLRIRYTHCDCLEKIRRLLLWLGVPFQEGAGCDGAVAAPDGEATSGASNVSEASSVAGTGMVLEL